MDNLLIENTIFPSSMGDELGGKTFEMVFKENPKIVEFAYTLWEIKECSGIFKQFLDYINSELKDAVKLKQHIARATELVRSLHVEKIPSYLRKYI